MAETKSLANGEGVERPAYSVTSLSVYEACPLQYHTTFVRRIPPPVTRAMKRGTNVHALIAEHFTKPQLLSRAIEPEVQGLLDAFLRSRFAMAPVAVESAFQLPFAGGDVRGRIDVVLPRPDGGLEIVDFKSGRAPERGVLDRSLQLPLYALAMSRRFELPPEQLSYTYFFLRDEAEVSFTSTDAGFAGLSARVDGVIGNIQAGNFNPPPDCACHACRWERQFRARRRTAPTWRRSE